MALAEGGLARRYSDDRSVVHVLDELVAELAHVCQVVTETVNLRLQGLGGKMVQL